MSKTEKKENSGNKESITKKQEKFNEKPSSKEKPDDEPSWYHYLIVIIVIGAIFGLAYGGYYFFTENDTNNFENKTMLYKYPYKVGNVTYNLHFESSLEDLSNMKYTIEPQKIDILNTINFRLSFMQYNGTDNGEVSKGSTKLASFLRHVHHYKFTNESFVNYNKTNCSSSTKRNKVIVFDPYSETNGVFYNETNGCIRFSTNDPQKMVDITDKFIYDMTFGGNEQY